MANVIVTGRCNRKCPYCFAATMIDAEDHQELTLAELVTIVDCHIASGDARISFCLLYTSPSPRDRTRSRMPSSA